ncbi:MAG TPA: amylo-alpha-1,6-glucosidase [Melioribacteraceae bacterium]|nr:amylo-alpha-1,6-glucosidase [Melioribacteraceae bacterium]
MKFLFSFLLLFTPVLFSQTKIALLDLNNSINSDKELKSAFEFLESRNEFKTSLISSGMISGSKKYLNDFQIVWIHRTDSTLFNKKEKDPVLISKLRDYVLDGGKLFLTVDALNYLNLMGFESVVPSSKYVDAVDGGYGRKLGLHSFRNHPVFTGLNGGAYLFNPTEDMKIRQVGFFGDSIPLNGKVVAVDWSYITLKEDSRLVVEYEEGKGKILAAGAYTYFAIPNNSSRHLEMFVQNCLYYLSGKYQEQKKYYWNYQPNSVKEFSAGGREEFKFVLNPASLFKKSDGLLLTNRFATENFWNVSGERILVMGKEKGGIDEVWAHPFMALRDYQVGIRFSYKDSVYWLNDERPEIEVRPESFTRIYKFRRAYLTETISASHDKPVSIINYEYRGVYPAKLVIKFRSNIRYMWPYSEKVFSSINYSTDKELNSFILKDGSGEHIILTGAVRKPLQSIIGQYENFEKKDSLFTGIASSDFSVGALTEYELKMNDNLQFVIAASNEGEDTTRNYFTMALTDPAKVLDDAALYPKEFFEKSLSITTPDKDFNEGYQWALIGTDRFRVNTPGLGKALVAGYSTTAKGWNGGHKVNGRPGYAWYFGRDAVWSSFALLDYGDFESVKSQLSFFNKYQDLNGKIFHELTTSGAVHYDASDATPLYLILAGRYLLHSGDVDFIRETWPNIKMAIDYCFSTDTDKDHLIENTNVGHGWVEGGGLYTAHTEVYLAACWAEALKMASVMAGSLMLNKESEMYNREYEKVKKIISEQFWNDESNFLSFSKLKDGSFNLEKTVLAAVPVYFEMLDKPKAINVIDDFAENYFSSDWGVRILRDDSPIYNPRGYHTGSVWPLFTGWTSLAEFKYGNHLQGYTHMMNNLLVYKNWQLGSVEEVLHGSEYKPSGVCSHQCWSQTMVLQPAIEGMLGLKVDALNNRIDLAPGIPADWDTLKVERIRIGKNFLNFTMKKEKGKTTYRFSTDTSEPVAVGFRPLFPSGTKFNSALLNDEPEKINLVDGGNINFSFNLSNLATLELLHEGGISVLPKVIIPKPGSFSEGLRILNERVEEDNYIVTVQGLSGSTGELEVIRENGKEIISVRFESGSGKYANKEIKLKY